MLDFYWFLKYNLVTLNKSQPFYNLEFLLTIVKAIIQSRGLNITLEIITVNVSSLFEHSLTILRIYEK